MFLNHVQNRRERVVLTSSIAAIAYNERPKTPEVVVDETWFSDPDYCRDLKKWYVLSKTLAEEAAWKFAKENSLDLVSLNPAMVVGPVLQAEINTSSAAVLNLINGSETFPNKCYGWINVKDFANTHIRAYEIASASGRYCLVESVAHYSEVVMILRDLYRMCTDEKPYEPTFQEGKELRD
ncbi:Cinnamoyl-CoA reductase 1 [Spatholobus suberectus]|nr:Cinnamoyl-CoA reductase 1 [Spatholobus suberectus]